MLTQSHRDPTGSRPATATAFLLAPGIAALAGGLVASLAALVAHPVDWVAVLAGPIFSAFFALVGYPTAAIVGVPIYLVLPEKARSAFAVVVPLAGAIAATPWILIAAPWRSGRSDLTMAGVAFALGTVAGIAFLFLRRPRAAAGEASEAVPDRRGLVDAL